MFYFRIFCLIVISGFTVGIIFSSFVDSAFDLIVLFLILILAFIGLFFIWERKNIFLIFILIFLGVVLGLLRWQLADTTDLKKVDCRNSCQALIVADPDKRDSSTRLIIKLDPSISLGARKILAITDNFSDYAYGDKIEISGRLEKPQNFLTNQGKIFDYQNYLAARGINQIVYYPKIKIVAHNQGYKIISVLYLIKNEFLNNLRQVIPEPAATLAGGLILGDKGGLGQKTENYFRQAGLSHIIVLSGYNITILAEVILFIFSLVVGAWSWLLGIVAIILFVIMAGGEAAAVRAAVMGVIALIARRYGRTYDAGVALVVAGFLMIVWNPRLLVFDLGFQLSFLATLGLIYLSPLVSARLKFLPDKNSGRELIATTIGAQIAVYPWLLYRAGNASLIGFISNVFVLPVIPFAMLLSFLTGFCGFISHHLSLFISYPTYFILEYILKIAELFAKLWSAIISLCAIVGF